MNRRVTLGSPLSQVSSPWFLGPILLSGTNKFQYIGWYTNTLKICSYKLHQASFSALIPPPKNSFYILRHIWDIDTICGRPIFTDDTSQHIYGLGSSLYILPSSRHLNLKLSVSVLSLFCALVFYRLPYSFLSFSHLICALLCNLCLFFTFNLLCCSAKEQHALT